MQAETRATGDFIGHGKSVNRLGASQIGQMFGECKEGRHNRATNMSFDGIIAVMRVQVIDLSGKRKAGTRK